MCAQAGLKILGMFEYVSTTGASCEKTISPPSRKLCHENLLPDFPGANLGKACLGSNICVREETMFSHIHDVSKKQDLLRNIRFSGFTRRSVRLIYFMNSVYHFPVVFGDFFFFICD